MSQSSVIDLPPGTVIDDKYVIIDLLGAGTAGIVYRAKHVALERQVALKILKQSLTDNEKVGAMFRNEASIIKALNHPNIVQVHAVGLADNSHPYIAMELLDGHRLDHVIESSGRIGVNTALPLFMQACAALQLAHDSGIVHRDVKPGNMVIVERDGQRLLKVVDFGVARILGEFKQASTSRFVGSVSYSSPEALQGVIDPRSDIYSLGCSLFEALTGMTPFGGTTFFEIADKHNNEPLPRVADFLPDEAFPSSLQTLLARMLEKKPENRYQSMRDVAADLERCASGEALSAMPAPIAVTLAPRRGKKPRFTALLVVAAVVASAALAFLVMKPTQKSGVLPAQRIGKLMRDADRMEKGGDVSAASAVLEQARGIAEESRDHFLRGAVQQKLGALLRRQALAAHDQNGLRKAHDELHSSASQLSLAMKEHLNDPDSVEALFVYQQAFSTYMELERVDHDLGHASKGADQMIALLTCFEHSRAYGAKDLRELVTFLDRAIREDIRANFLERAQLFAKQRIRCQKLLAVDGKTIAQDGKVYADLVRRAASPEQGVVFATKYLDDTVKSPERLREEYSSARQ